MAEASVAAATKPPPIPLAAALGENNKKGSVLGRHP
jgi:hypothetical protein